MIRSFQSGWFRRAITSAALLVPAVARGQLTTDQVPHGRTIPPAQQIQDEMAKSRFRLGPIRLIPVFRISEAGYDDNVLGATSNEGRVSDWLGSVSAGTHAIAPLSRKIFLKGSLLPEYTYYQKLTQRRTFGGQLQASMIGAFNRFSLQGNTYIQRGFDVLNTQTELRILRTSQGASANFEIDLLKRTSLLAGGEIHRLRFSLGGIRPVEPFDIKSLDRSEGVVFVGLTYRVSPSLGVSAAVEGTRTGFLLSSQARLRDNESIGYLVGLHYNRPRLYLNFTGGYREGRAWRDSVFPDFETTTGSYFASFFVFPSVELQLHGRRRLEYGAIDILESPYSFVTSNAARINLEVRPRLSLNGFAEYGTNEFEFTIIEPPLEAPTERRVPRRVPYLIYGGGFSVNLFRKAVLTAGIDRRRYSSAPEKRNIFRFTAGISLEGELAR